MQPHKNPHFQGAQTTHGVIGLTPKSGGQQLKKYYQACTTDELPPRLFAVLKKLDEEIEPSAKGS
jgi:hypothetical protein